MSKKKVLMHLDEDLLREIHEYCHYNEISLTKLFSDYMKKLVGRGYTESKKDLQGNLSGTFSLEKLIKAGLLEDRQIIYYAADPSYQAILKKNPKGKYKLYFKYNEYSPMALVINWLKMKPNNPGLQWLKVKTNESLYELWDKYLTKG